jgi:hypothetical protein
MKYEYGVCNSNRKTSPLPHSSFQIHSFVIEQIPKYAIRIWNVQQQSKNFTHSHIHHSSFKNSLLNKFHLPKSKTPLHHIPGNHLTLYIYTFYGGFKNLCALFQFHSLVALVQMAVIGSFQPGKFLLG